MCKNDLISKNLKAEGDKALFGGLSAEEMKNKVGCPKNTPLEEYVNHVVVTGMDFANEMANLAIRMNNLHDSEEIRATHVKTNTGVRNAIVETIGIAPEDLPPRDNITIMN